MARPLESGHAAPLLRRGRFRDRGGRSSDRDGRFGGRSGWSKGRSLAFFLGALDWAEAAAIGRSLRSLFRSLHMKLDENLRNELEIAIDFLNDAYPRSIFN